jgi:heptosyltransferase III
VQIVVHEGPADAEPVAQLSRLLPTAIVVRDPTLPALAGVLARCAAYIGNDSGVSHLAAAVGAPAVVLFDAANLAWRPWAPAPRVVTVVTERVTDRDLGSVRSALDAVLR